MLAAVGADVVMTDRDPDVLSQLDLNVKENTDLKGQAVVRKLSWGDAYLETRGDVKEDFGTYDMVVGADIIYGESLNGPYKNLINTLKSTVSSNTEVLIAFQERGSTTFWTMAADSGFAVSEVQTTQADFKLERKRPAWLGMIKLYGLRAGGAGGKGGRSRL